jgi:hypothetical protein
MAAPKKGTPERFDYNSSRWSDKKNIPGMGHKDRPEFEAWRTEKETRARQAKNARGNAEVKEAKQYKAQAKEAQTAQIISQSQQAPKSAGDTTDVDRSSAYEPTGDNFPKAVNYDTKHGDMMHNIGLKLEGHIDNAEKAGHDVRDLHEVMGAGWDALNKHTDAHLGGNARMAKDQIKEAAGHFSRVYSALNQRVKGNIPKVQVSLGGNRFTDKAVSLGELAVGTSNAYINSANPGEGGNPIEGRGNTPLKKSPSLDPDVRTKKQREADDLSTEDVERLRRQPEVQRELARVAEMGRRGQGAAKSDMTHLDMAKERRTPGERESAVKDAVQYVQERRQSAFAKGFSTLGPDRRMAAAERAGRPAPTANVDARGSSMSKQEYVDHRRVMLKSLDTGQKMPKATYDALGKHRRAAIQKEYDSYAAQKGAEAADETIAESRNAAFRGE